MNRKLFRFLRWGIAVLMIGAILLGPASADAAGKKGRRPVPDLDGREDPPPRPGEVLLWIPRVLAFPLYVVSEFVLRRPLGFLVRAAERHRWPSLFVNFFTFGRKRNAALVPTAVFDFGLRASVGGYFFWRDAGAEGNLIQVRAATGGRRYVKVTVSDRYRFASDVFSFKLRLEGTRRADGVFYGIGPSSSDRRFRYRSDRFDARFTVAAMPWRKTVLSAWAGWRRMRFPEGTCCAELSVRDEVARAYFDLPPGLEGYALLLFGLESVLDTRRDIPANGSGFVIHGFAEVARPIGSRGGAWIRYGGTAAGFLDLTGTHRVIGIAVTTIFADPFGTVAVPFTELASLGGGGHRPGEPPLRGFLEGQLIGESAIAAYIDYEWPIWVWLSGNLRFEVGNAFGSHLDGFAFDLLRMSFGGGIRTTKLGGSPFELLIAVGTAPFRGSEGGARIESFRFSLGMTRGF